MSLDWLAEQVAVDVVCRMPESRCPCVSSWFSRTSFFEPFLISCFRACDTAPSCKIGFMHVEEVKEDGPRYRIVDDFRVGDDRKQLLLSEDAVDIELTLLRSNVDLCNLFLEEFFCVLV